MKRMSAARREMLLREDLTWEEIADLAARFTEEYE